MKSLMEDNALKSEQNNLINSFINDQKNVNSGHMHKFIPKNNISIFKRQLISSTSVNYSLTKIDNKSLTNVLSPSTPKNPNKQDDSKLIDRSPSFVQSIPESENYDDSNNIKEEGNQTENILNEAPKIQVIESTSSTRMNQGVKLNLSVEKVISSSHISNTVTYINIFFILFVSTNFALALINYFYQKSLIDLANDDLNALSDSFSQLDDLVEINRRAFLIQLVSKGLMKNDRQSVLGVHNFQIYCMTKIQTTLAALKNDSSNLENFLYTSTADNYKNSITNSIITAYWTNNNEMIKEQEFKLFDGIRFFIEQCYALITIDTIKIKPNNKYLSFIIDNALNDYLINISKSAYIFIDSFTSEIKLIKILLLGITGVGYFLLFSSLIFYFIQLINLENEKSEIINLLLKIKQEDTRLILKRLQLIKDYSDKISHYSLNYKEIQFFFDNKYKIEAEFQKNVITQHKVNTITVNKTRFYDGTLIKLVKWIFLTSFLASYYILESLSASNSQDVCLKISNQITTTHSSMYKKGLAISIAYQFIANNGTGNINGDPIQNVINEQLNILQDDIEFLAVFLNENEVESSITSLLSDDLCPFLTPAVASICYSYANGAGSRGFTGLDSYIYRTMNNAYNIFLESDKSFNSTFDIFQNNNLQSLEVVLYVILRPMYVIVLNKLKYLFVEIKNEIETQTEILTSVFCVSLVIIYYIILLPLKMNFEQENKTLKTFIALVPVNLIVQNKYIMRYLILMSPENAILLRR